MEQSSQQAFLIFEEGALRDQKIAISKHSIIIGRGGRNVDCDIVLPERQVSRQHAEIFLDQGLYYLRDLGSKVCKSRSVRGFDLSGQTLRYRSSPSSLPRTCAWMNYLGGCGSAPKRSARRFLLLNIGY